MIATIITIIIILWILGVAFAGIEGMLRRRASKRAASRYAYYESIKTDIHSMKD